MRTPTTSVLLFLATLAMACVPATAAPPLSGPTVVTTSPTPPAATPTATSAQAATCYYVWSSRDLPDLSQELNRELRAVDPALSGGAYAYGEDCVAADGTRTFSAMETDFQIHAMVGDLADKERMGNAIGDAMAVIAKLPPSELQGPQPGRAEFEFVTSTSDSLRLNVDIAWYGNQAAGLKGAGLFEALQSAQ
jgi:hypothetical protein